MRHRPRSRAVRAALRGLCVLSVAPIVALACGDDVVAPEDRTPATLEPRGGDAQTAVVGTEVTVPPSVVVLDDKGRPVPGVEVIFRVSEGGGSITGAIQTTDAEGEARVGSWTLGETPGTNRLSATVSGLEPAALLATARVGAPDEILLEESPPDSAVAGTSFTGLPRVRVVDRFGNSVPAVSVDFQVVAGGGTVEPATTSTGSEGLASPDRWTLGSRTGENTLQVSVDGVEAVLVSVEGVTGEAAVAVAIQGDDQQGEPGDTLSLAPAVRIEDALGNPVEGVEVAFTVVQGGGSVHPASVTTDTLGVAEADFWVLGQETGEEVVEARASGLDPVLFNATVVAGEPRDLQILEGDDQTGIVSTETAVQPAVLLVDGSGNPVPGYPIDFAVREGGGSVSPGRVDTDAQGVARTDWTLGPTVGLNTLEAKADGFDQVVFTATAESDGPSEIVKVAGDGQGAEVGSTLPVDPSVQVVDALGNGVAGVEVHFEVVEGGGSVTGGVQVTGSDGVATVGFWTLGSTAGRNRLRVAGGGVDPVHFTATALDPDSYNLEIRLVSDANQAQQDALESARLRWTSIVVGDLDPVQITLDADACVTGQPAVDEVVDDLVIYVRAEPIDGPGGVLGSAGPCVIRSESGLPVVGVVNVDSDDLEQMETDGILDAVVLHELGHVLGIGTLWTHQGLLVGEGTTDPYFTGEAALDAWVDINGPSVYSGDPVPVENSGGAGTRDSHWRETVLGDELMTGFVDPLPMPLSVLTVASLADLGYIVDLSQADSFDAAAAPPLAPSQSMELREVPLPPPVEVSGEPPVELQ